ncbi:hypothetical protein [Microbacterium murale]|uniref:DUF4352 domain-containing protein n=1 Tax=Microbacterium murale TaxID=1081040 RepID=A0ABU0PAM0_9MICO|nr:hypothetical protein [Microbacterium murale]MDQ0644384.1 hypothetical protein [Microbacterium murale]
MTLPQPSDDAWVDPRIPAPPVADAPSIAVAPRDSRNGLVLALAIVCAVLLITTIGFGGVAAWLWFDRSAVAAPQPPPTPTSTSATAADEPQIVQGIEVSTVSDLVFGSFAMSKITPDDYVGLYATVTNEDPERAAELYFDVTAYAEDGSILDRGPTSVYILPGQVSMFQGVFSSDITDAVSIRVEQTMGEFAEPIMTGEVTTDKMLGGEGYVEATLVSTLSQVPEYPDVYIAGYVDGKLFGVCSDMPDIPSNAGFTSGCYLEAVSADSQAEFAEFTEFPKDAEFEAYLALDLPW